MASFRHSLDSGERAARFDKSNEPSLTLSKGNKITQSAIEIIRNVPLMASSGSKKALNTISSVSH